MKRFSLLLLLSCLSLIVAPRVSFGAYCTPGFYDPGSACYTYGMNISQFTIIGESGTTINDYTGCSGSGYEDLTSTTMTVSLMPSHSYTTTIASSGTYGLDCEVWIDFNNNTTFESSESVGGRAGYTSSATFTITIPPTVSTGTHRMRVMTIYNSGSTYYPGIDPCASYYNYGDVHDYMMNISTSGTLGVSSAIAAGEVQVYPNPANDELTIKLGGIGNSKLEMINSVGVVVMHQAINANETKLNVKSLAPGVYNIKINGESGTVVKQFVKL